MGETLLTPDILMKGVIASYLASTQGVEIIYNYISSSFRDYPQLSDE